MGKGFSASAVIKVPFSGEEIAPQSSPKKGTFYGA